jgi:hypothetical protein
MMFVGVEDGIVTTDGFAGSGVIEQSGGPLTMGVIRMLAGVAGPLL